MNEYFVALQRLAQRGESGFLPQEENEKNPKVTDFFSICDFFPRGEYNTTSRIEISSFYLDFSIKLTENIIESAVPSKDITFRTASNSGNHMVRDKIGFKNARALIFKPGLDELFNKYEDNSFVDNWLDKAQARSIQSVYLLTSGATSHQNSIFEQLRASFEKRQMNLKELSLSDIESRNYQHVVDVCREIQYLVKKENCLFLFSDRKQKQADLFAAMFMLTLKSMRSIEPEYAIKYITGKTDTSADFQSVYDFKKFLSPDYEIPEQAQDKLKESVDLAVEKSEGQKANPATNGQRSGAISSSGEPISSPLDNDSSPSQAKPDAADSAPERGDAVEPDSEPDASNQKIVPIVHTATVESPVKPVKKFESGKSVDTSAQPNPARGDFKRSKFSIKVKLLGIISSIIVGALLSMILIASAAFSTSIETKIQENNLNLATILGGRIEQELDNMGYKAHLMAVTLDQHIGNPAQRQLYTDLFFQNNPDFLFLGVARQIGDRLIFSQQLNNADALQKIELDPKKLSELHDTNAAQMQPSFNGAFKVFNASQGMSVPILGLSQPLNDGTIVVLYLNPSTFLKSFQTKGVTAFMVDDRGSVIAHKDSKLVLAGENMKDLKIVASLLKSRVDVGSMQYEDSEDIEFLGSYKKLNTSGLGIVTTVESKKAFEAVAKIRLTNLIIMVIIVAISFIVIFFFAKSLSEPIKDLADATNQIERGDYNISINPLTHDEVGYLTHSFSHMAVGLAERERAKDALGRFVNKQVAELALSGDIALGGETKEAAVFFSDLRGFTAMSEGMTPEEVVAYLNEYFTGMVNAVVETFGIVDKFIGDAVMAHWGAFGSQGNNTENAVNGALLMRKAIIAFNENGAGKRPFAKMGCGINTGSVVSGQIGSEERFEFTVIGDTVNLASRIEALNKPFGTDVLISKDSYDLVKDIFKVVAQPSIKVKGKSEPQAIFAVLGRKDDPDCPKDLRQVRDMLGIVFDESQVIDPDAKEEKFEVVG